MRPGTLGLTLVLTSTILEHEVKSRASAADTRALTAGSPNCQKQRLKLYLLGDFPINFRFLHCKFNTAMVTFLESLRQLSEFVENY